MEGQADAFGNKGTTVIEQLGSGSGVAIDANAFSNLNGLSLSQLDLGIINDDEAGMALVLFLKTLELIDGMISAL